MSSLNHSERGSTVPSAPTPKAQGVNRLALATALVGSLVTAACGEKVGKSSCTEPMSNDYLEYFESETDDGADYVSAYAVNDLPGCFNGKHIDTSKSPLYVGMKVHSAGRQTTANRNLLSNEDTSQNPGKVFQRDWRTHVLPLTVGPDDDVGDTFSWGVTEAPDLPGHQVVTEEAAKRARICLYLKDGAYEEGDFQKNQAKYEITCSPEFPL